MQRSLCCRALRCMRSTFPCSCIAFHPLSVKLFLITSLVFPPLFLVAIRLLFYPSFLFTNGKDCTTDFEQITSQLPSAKKRTPTSNTYCAARFRPSPSPSRPQHLSLASLKLTRAQIHKRATCSVVLFLVTTTTATSATTRWRTTSAGFP
jgi:hypothetical protein